MSPIPITIITGFLGSGKTTLLLSLLPQLKALDPSYKLALLKNEFGDLAVDSQLATASSISSVRELLNGCICCNLVGSLSTAIAELRDVTPGLNRIVIETSGSAFPATLAMEVNRLARENDGAYSLDGVVTVIDVENWKGYEDTSVTARIQARYTDLIVFNKWELCDERKFDDALDRVGDLETDVAWVKSDHGKVPVGLVFGIDGGLARSLGQVESAEHNHSHTHGSSDAHTAEVEVLSVTLSSANAVGVDINKLRILLEQAPKDEIYRIKAVFTSLTPLASSDASMDKDSNSPSHRYILNWAFGRWTVSPLQDAASEHESSKGVVLRMTLILARYESKKWERKLVEGGLLCSIESGKDTLNIERLV